MKETGGEGVLVHGSTESCKRPLLTHLALTHPRLPDARVRPDKCVSVWSSSVG